MMAQDKEDVQIREMVETDLGRVYAMDRLLFGNERTPTWSFSFEAYWNVYRPELRFIAELGDEIVGFIVGNIVEEHHNQAITSLTHTLSDFNRHRWVAWIDMIGINPAYQGRGIGKGLVDAFHAECKKKDAVMRGVARESDDRLKGFLEAMGFRKWDIATYEKH
jgi:ribosomal protein S18 acetylase RimI-like enzyme